MKAPDKIYLGIDDIGSVYVYNFSLDNNGHSEYIRKDVLLELLREKRKAITECSATKERKVSALSVIDFLIDKISNL